MTARLGSSHHRARKERNNTRAVVELVVAAAVFGGAVLSWVRSRSTVAVAPIVNGEPSTTSVAYYAPLLVLALVLATVAGVLAVIAVARLRRGSVDTASAPPSRPETPG